MKYVLIALLFISQTAASQKKIVPTLKELSQLNEMLSPGIACTYYHYPDFYDTTTVYVEFFKAGESENILTQHFGIACFKFYVNPTYTEDRHWVVCDCQPLDIALSAARLLYRKQHHIYGN